MNPIGFQELGGLTGAIDYPDEVIDAVDPKDCPRRAPEVVSAKSGRVSAICNFLSDECGRSVGVGARVCHICRCHSAATHSNEYLVKQIVQTAWASTVAGERADEPMAPTDDEIAVALENIRLHLGDEIARRYVDTLVYNESVTAQKGDALLATIEAV